MSQHPLPLAAVPPRAHPPSDSATRAPRLTDHRLDDLDVAVLSLDCDITYLAEAINGWPVGHPLRSRLQTKHDALVRARAWIVGKVAAERAQRVDA